MAWDSLASFPLYQRRCDDSETIMKEAPKLAQHRRLVRILFDPQRPIAQDDLRKVLEAGRWTPTPHNMQNLEIMIVDEQKVLERRGQIRSPVSETFLLENNEQLLSSEEISVRIMNDFSDAPVQDEVKSTLGISARLRIANGLRQGYPAPPPAKGLRVRRDVDEFAYRNEYGDRGSG
jgi:nitroreductase